MISKCISHLENEISMPKINYILMCHMHGGLTGKLTKCVQYGINDLYLYWPGFYVPDTSGSSRTVHKFVQVVTYRTLDKKADGQKITYCTDICLPK